MRVSLSRTEIINKSPYLLAIGSGALLIGFLLSSMQFTVVNVSIETTDPVSFDIRGADRLHSCRWLETFVAAGAFHGKFEGSVTYGPSHSCTVRAVLKKDTNDLFIRYLLAGSIPSPIFLPDWRLRTSRQRERWVSVDCFGERYDMPGAAIPLKFSCETLISDGQFRKRLLVVVILVSVFNLLIWSSYANRKT